MKRGYVTRKGIRYYANRAAAARIALQLRPKHPSSRIVKYELGWAVQYRISGFYFPEEEGS